MQRRLPHIPFPGRSTFRTVLKITIGVVFALIFIGGLVRASGSGMGCPDWPKCFGKLIPPTDVSQLPSNYREIYKDHGYASQPFNAAKTWTEYFNRLFGALTGLFCLWTAYSSLIYRKRIPMVTWLCFTALGLVILEGIIGAVVVRMNLAHQTVTLHFLLAFLIIAVLIMAVIQSGIARHKMEHIENHGNESALMLLASLVMVMLQVIIGTAVRGNIDRGISLAPELPRSSYIELAGNILGSHRVLSFAVSLMCIISIYLTRNISKFVVEIKFASWLVIACLSGQMITGWLLYTYGFPAFAQPFHILLSSGIFAGLFYMMLLCFRLNKSNNEEYKAYKISSKHTDR